MREQRRHPRVPLRMEVRWNGASNTRPGITSDVSQGGCYIESMVQPTVGEVLWFEFQLAPGLTMDLYGQVLYGHRNIGFGVRFGQLTNAQLKMLLRLIGSTRAQQNNPPIAQVLGKNSPRIAA